ncbi:MAG: hypothetical protein V4812_07025 [Pseudomonadota bacterium]
MADAIAFTPPSALALFISGTCAAFAQPVRFGCWVRASIKTFLTSPRA